MRVIKTELPEVLLIEPKVFGDERGYFMETFQAERYKDCGIPGPFVQDNLSFSRKGVLRGLHFQNPNAQGKLVYVLQGAVFDVAVDVRVGSASFGKWVGHELSSENRRQLWVPEGFAHGFVVLSETALFAYKCTRQYDSASEHSVRWDDKEIGIQWPVESPLVSVKDEMAPALSLLSRDKLPRCSMVR